MKAKPWLMLMAIGLLFSVLVTLRNGYVYAAEDHCNGTCPVGSVCEQTGPSTWACESDGSAPPPPPTSTGEWCNESSAPSCGGDCNPGSTCRSTQSNPSCHCSGGTGGEICPSGYTYTCGTPAVIKCVNNQAGCPFPGKFTGWQDGDETPRCRGTSPGKQFCQTNCTCAVNCSATAPIIGSIVQGASATTATISWTPGTGGTQQLLRVDEDLVEVNAACPTPGDCEASVNLPTSTSSYLVSNLSPSRAYYFRIVNYCA